MKKTININEVENNKYYNVHFHLKTPYICGEGYANASNEEIIETEETIDKILVQLGLVCVETKSSYSSNSYYDPENETNEIYAHPECLAGKLTGFKIKKIEEIFNQLNSPVVSCTGYYIEEAKNYSFEEVLNTLSSLTKENFLTLKKKHYMVAMNYELEDFLTIPFISTGFVNNKLNRDLRMKKNFIVGYINERLKGL